VKGMVKQTYHITGSALRALATARIRTKEISPDGQFLGAYVYTGIPLYHLLEGIAPKKPDEIAFDRPVDLRVTFTSLSGREASFSYGELIMTDDRNPVTLAFHRKPLMPSKDPETYSKNLCPGNIEGLRLICPRDPDISRYLDEVVSITLGVYETPDPLLPPWREKWKCSSHSLTCVTGGKVWPASLEGLEQQEVRDWIRVGHGHGFMGISSARGYPFRSFLRKNFPGCGSRQDFIVVSCDGFRVLFSGPEIFLNEEGKSLLLLTEMDGKEAQGRITIAPMGDYFVDRDVWGITHIVMVDRK
ncbi:MAG: hypothetical protein JW821_01975, partial [Deltaproteobacteria bacterium]|nr:hypothetical protein [Deltaproteobacteria bacterium]